MRTAVDSSCPRPRLRARVYQLDPRCVSSSTHASACTPVPQLGRQIVSAGQIVRLPVRQCIRSLASSFARLSAHPPVQHLVSQFVSLFTSASPCLPARAPPPVHQLIREFGGLSTNASAHTSAHPTINQLRMSSSASVHQLIHPAVHQLIRLGQLVGQILWTLLS